MLASGSPRRRELVAGLLADTPPDGCTIGSWEIRAVDTDEEARFSQTLDAGGTLAEALLAVTLDKLEAARSQSAVDELHRSTIFLAADTMVVGPDGAALGKPVDHAHAEAMMRGFSGATIQVLTVAAAARGADSVRQQLVTTDVHLTEIDQPTIDAYLATDVPWDKAGALELQGASAGLVRSFDGCWSNMLGLPVCVVAEWLGFADPALECPHPDGIACPDYRRNR